MISDLERKLATKQVGICEQPCFNKCLILTGKCINNIIVKQKKCVLTLIAPLGPPHLCYIWITLKTIWCGKSHKWLVLFGV